ncbi:hypothetical protein [Leucobacter japonicus]|uniref:hypothetical protein n=1 Tax=Leucobacter japonicus TaxID=1461259 RepID=UPI0006A7DD98|nr:hypothetical protein [Leucobacter japonicus]
MYTRITSPRTRTRFILAPALALAAAVALSGCTGGASDASSEDEAVGPLQQYLSALYDENEFTQEKLDEQNAKTEALIAECMTKEGFEYQPNTNNGSVMYSSETDGDEPEWGSVEFAEQYGYGITSWPGGDEAMDDMEEYVDPNGTYLESLSESERDAFYETLYGPQDESALDEDGSYEYDWTTAGCQGAAQHEIQDEQGGSQAAYEDPQFAELFEAMNTVYEPFYGEETNSPEVAELDQQWASCMADRGVDEFTSPNTAAQEVSEESNALYSGGGEDEYSEPDQEQLDAFKKREIEVAVADATCKKQVEYDRKLQKLTFAAEQDFIDEHRAELDALVAQYGVKK